MGKLRPKKVWIMQFLTELLMNWRNLDSWTCPASHCPRWLGHMVLLRSSVSLSGSEVQMKGSRALVWKDQVLLQYCLTH